MTRLVFVFDCMSCTIAYVLTYCLFCVGDDEMQLGEIHRQRRSDAYKKVEETYGTEDVL